MTLCNLSEGYQGFGGTECPHIQDEGTRKFTVSIIECSYLETIKRDEMGGTRSPHGKDE